MGSSGLAPWGIGWRVRSRRREDPGIGNRESGMNRKLGEPASLEFRRARNVLVVGGHPDDRIRPNLPRPASSRALSACGQEDPANPGQRPSWFRSAYAADHGRSAPSAARPRGGFLGGLAAVSRWSRDGPAVVPRWFRGGPAVVPRWSRDGIATEWRRGRNLTALRLRWACGGTAVVSRWSRAPRLRVRQGAQFD